MSKYNDIKYTTIIPLVGGMTLGNMKTVGNGPEFLCSYSDFWDNDKHILNYLKGVPYFNLENKKNSNIIKNNYRESLDFVSTTCPCAGLSTLNTSKNSPLSRGSDALQNQWMYKSANWVLENLKPKVFWGENAPGLWSSIGKGVREKLYGIAKDHGYSFSIIKTDTLLHGIPQRRRRTFYFFWKSETSPLLEWYDRSNKTKSLDQYLKEIPNNALYKDVLYSKSYDLSKWKLLDYILEKTGKSLKEFRDIYRGRTFAWIVERDLIDDAMQWIEKNHPSLVEEREYKKLKYIKEKHNDKFWDMSPFITKDHTNAVMNKNMYATLHPSENRLLNMREYMWLMGLPHDFEIVGEKKDWRVISQNVPVNTVADWTEQVIKFIKGELPLSKTDYLFQDNTSQTVNEVLKPNALF